MNTKNLSAEFWEFVERHKNDDVAKLALKAGAASSPEIKLAITHIGCLQKSGKKFVLADGSELRPPLLGIPLSVEQSSSSQIAQFHASLVAEESRVLDMTAGLGLDMLAISRVRGTEILGFELNVEVAELARYNFRDIPNVKVVEGDSVDFVRNCDSVFDVVFIDPARRGEKGERVYNLSDCAPDITGLREDIFKIAPRFIAKLSPMIDPVQTLRDLPETSKLYAVDNGMECKELLVVAERGFVGTPTIIVRNGEMEFSFTREEEMKARLLYREPEQGMIVLEPSAATMKAAPFKTMSERFGIYAFAQSTHLYTGDSVIENFPGKQYRIEAVEEYSSSNIKTFARRYPKLNLATRNFPFTAEETAKRLKIKQGGNIRGFAATTALGKRVVVIATQV